MRETERDARGLMVVSVVSSLRWAIKTAIKVIMASARTNVKRSEINDREDRVTYGLHLLLPPQLP